MGRKTSESLAGDEPGHPVGWWKLDQTSGRQVTDSSGTGATATASDNVTWADSAASMTGAAGTQIATNGPVVDTTQSFTVSAWIKPTTLGGNTQTLVSQDGVQQSGFYLQYGGWNGKWTFQRMSGDVVNPQGVVATGTTTPAAGTWTHLVGVYNAGNGQMTQRRHDRVRRRRAQDQRHQTELHAARRLLADRGRTHVGVQRRRPGRRGPTRSAASDPAGVVTETAYDQLGRVYRVYRVYRVERADGTVTRFGYNLLDQAVRVVETDTDGSTVLRTATATYDGTGTKLSETDAKGHTTTFTNDALGRVTSQTEPVDASNGIVVSFGYDANGREITRTSPGGVVATTQYDALGAVTGQTGTGAEAATANRSFTYDADGRVLTVNTSSIGMSVPATNTTFTYDDRGNLLTTAGSAGSSSFAYNADGLLTSRTDAAGTTTYGYDTGQRLTTLQDPASGSTLTYNYDTVSRLQTISYGTGANTRTFDYDPLQRLTGDTLKNNGGTTLASVSYGYDLNDNVTSKTTTGVSGASANTYTYDFADRLTNWTTGSTTTVYEYDDSGNRVRLGADVFTYDARNQLTSDGEATYTYSARGTLLTSTKAGNTVNYTSDAYGQQITEATLTGGTQTYVNDALGRNVSASGPAGNITFAYSGKGNNAASDGSHTYTRDPGDGLIGIGPATPTGNGVLALTDLHDDVVANFKPTTGLTGSRTYDPLGKVTSTAGMEGNLGYQSDWTDAATGKVNMGARWYTPSLGLFQNKDTVALSPIPNSISANAFAYADANPLTMLDPDGHAAIPTANTGGRGALTTTTPVNTKKSQAAAKKAAEEAKTLQKLKAAENKLKQTRAKKTNSKKIVDAKKPAKKVAVKKAKQQPVGRGPVKTAKSNKDPVGVNINPASFGIGDALKILAELAWELTFADFYHCLKSPTLGTCAMAGLSLIPAGKLVKLLSFLGPKAAALAKIIAGSGGKKDDAKVTQEARDLLNGGNKPKKPTVCPRKNSFIGSTLVLMADGSTKPISEIKVGDKVQSSVPGDDEPEIHTVEAVIVTKADRDYVDLKITTPEQGRAPPSVGKLTTTAHHKFYNITQSSFVDAEAITPGDQLQQPNGTPATVLSTHHYKSTQTTYDLTIPTLHTYYVLAGSAPVLVHNASCENMTHMDKMRAAGGLDSLSSGQLASLKKFMQKKSSRCRNSSDYTAC
ncbi:hypothetical protein LO762_12625 [Actinocorallia sp. API 0066]|uniref:RHS repeat-associated core domain-containing protein n=1 Tax=Actinocorallia sp. API 0066 TaxID=2896846 RepID=UPI001E48DA9E|nr:RHS repeat-associated core domain-containing protein [Actinocorallia sp. API 0066]MCD0450030.1 hypothetical protein [Actinocorallia sp. API 0066]